jgi:hypothetical protein
LRGAGAGAGSAWRAVRSEDSSGRTFEGEAGRLGVASGSCSMPEEVFGLVERRGRLGPASASLAAPLLGFDVPVLIVFECSVWPAEPCACSSAIREVEL